jgi:hypothetical protein
MIIIDTTNAKKCNAECGRWQVVKIQRVKE